jgi:hypothetical protein
VLHVRLSHLLMLVTAPFVLETLQSALRLIHPDVLYEIKERQTLRLHLREDLVP